MDKKLKRSCIDCGVINCDQNDRTYPDFCLTTSLDENVLDEALSLYTEDEENSKAVLASAEVEYENYCKMTRVEEIVEFAKKTGF